MENPTKFYKNLDKSEVSTAYIERYNTGGHMARTIRPENVTSNPLIFSILDSGWFVRGQIFEDWFEWVNEFEAWHPEHGFVYGDFEDMVFASSKETLDKFIEEVGFEEWDYWDI